MNQLRVIREGGVLRRRKNSGGTGGQKWEGDLKTVVGLDTTKNEERGSSDRFNVKKRGKT